MTNGNASESAQILDSTDIIDSMLFIPVYKHIILEFHRRLLSL